MQGLALFEKIKVCLFAMLIFWRGCINVILEVLQSVKKTSSKKTIVLSPFFLKFFDSVMMPRFFAIIHISRFRYTKSCDF